MQQAPKPPLEKQGRTGARRKAKKARKKPQRGKPRRGDFSKGRVSPLAV